MQQNTRKVKERNQGITLIALIVTIIVLIILAGIAVNLLLGENGLLQRAKDSKTVYDKSSLTEKMSLLLMDYKIERETTGKTLQEYLTKKNVEYEVDGENVKIEEDGYIVTINAITLEMEEPVKATRTAKITLNKNIVEPEEAFTATLTLGEDVDITKCKYKLEKANVTVEKHDVTTGVAGTSINLTAPNEKGEYYLYLLVGYKNSDETLLKKVKVIVDVEITGIELNETSIELNNGDTKNLTASVLPANAEQGVIWNTSNSEIATVDQQGIITAVSRGIAVITATSNANTSIKATCTVNVINKIEISENVSNINTSAKILDIDTNTVTINNETIKVSTISGNFEVGDKIMLYVSNTNDANVVGSFDTFNITNINENNITLDKNINTSVFTNVNSQIIKILKYDKVTIAENVTVTPSLYDGVSGGVIAIEAENIILKGKIDVSKAGYDSSNLAPNNGGYYSSSYAGGSNKYKGGNGGQEYNNSSKGYASDPINIVNNLLNNRMTFGGGSSGTKGGGIVYINTKNLQITSQYAISANGQGANNVNFSGGGAGGTICINSKNITFNTNEKNYFVGANAGSGGSEGYNYSNKQWVSSNGSDGTNIKGGDAPGNVNGRVGGTGYLSNGGGGCQQAYDGGNATATQGGTGADGTSWSGWNATSGGGGRRICFNLYRYRPF